jgi:hypothetical protein
MSHPTPDHEAEKLAWMKLSEWWQDKAIPSSDTCRGHRYIDIDDIPDIIAEAQRLERERMQKAVTEKLKKYVTIPDPVPKREEE